MSEHLVPFQPQLPSSPLTPPPQGGRPLAEDNEIQIRELWAVLARNKLLIALCILVVAGGVMALTYMATPVFRASATLRLDEKGPTAREFDFLAGVGDRGQLATEIEVLRSRTMMGEIVDSLGLQVEATASRAMPRDELIDSIRVTENAPYREYRLTPDGRGMKIEQSGTSVAGVARVDDGWVQVDSARFRLRPQAFREKEVRIRTVPRRKAIDDLRRAVNVSRPARDANVLVIRYEGTDPELAYKIPNLVAARFIAGRNLVMKTEARSTTAFLRKQLDTIALQLAKAELQLQQFRERQQIVDIEAEAGSSVSQIATLKAQRSEIETQRRSLGELLREARARSNGRDATAFAKLLAYPTLLNNPSSAQYLSSLLKLQDERATLLSRRTSADPDVIALTTRIAELQGQIVEFVSTYLSGLDQQASALDRTLVEYGSQVEALPAREIELARLQRQPKVLENVYSVLQARLKEAEITQAVEDPSVRVIDAAYLPLRAVKPNKRINLAMGLIAGLLVGIIAAFGRDRLDQTVHTREEVQAATGTVLLGLIPPIPGGTSPSRRIGRLASVSRALSANEDPALGASDRSAVSALPRVVVAGTDPQSPTAEAYRALRTNIAFAQPDRPLRSIMFTSAMPGDGKTTTTANLGVTLAQQDLRILLLDADMRRGTLHDIFGLPRAPGLSNVLAGAATGGDVIRRVTMSGGHSVDVVTTGTLPPNPAELLASDRMTRLLEELGRSYDMILIDTPPLGAVTDAAVLGTKSDAVVFVTRASATNRGSLAYAVDQLRHVRANVIGVVLNDFDSQRDTRYYSYGQYGYGYHYSYASGSADPQRSES